MDVKQFRACIDSGIIYNGMRQEVEELYNNNQISAEDYRDLMQRIDAVKKSAKGVMSVSQAEGKSENLTVEQQDAEEPNTTTLLSNSAAEETSAAAEETVSSSPENSENDSDENTPTEEPTRDSSDNQEEQTFETPENSKVADWISEYRGYLYEWSVRNLDRKIEKFDSEENSFQASFKDGVELNFTSPSNVAIKAADPSSPKASDFDALLEIAKRSDQDIKLSDKMSEGFRKALVEACAKANVKITNLSKEDAELYISFVSNQTETNLNDNENSDSQPETPNVDNQEHSS